MQRAMKRVGAENHYFFCGRDIIAHKAFNVPIETAWHILNESQKGLSGVETHARLSPRMRFAIKFLLLQALVLMLARVGFWVFFRDSGVAAASGDTLRALYLGSKFDLRLGAILTAVAVALSLWPDGARVLSGVRGIVRSAFLLLIIL